MNLLAAVCLLVGTLSYRVYGIMSLEMTSVHIQSLAQLKQVCLLYRNIKIISMACSQWLHSGVMMRD